MNKLFHIQDTDRPMWVVATDWQEAVTKWRNVIAAENPGEDDIDSIQPQGIEFVCDSDELIISGTTEA